MDYNNFINKDFRSRSRHTSQQVQLHQHPALRWVTFALGCAVIGVVIANTTESETDHIKLEPEKLIKHLEQDNSKSPNHSPRERKRVKLNLPSSTSQADIDALYLTDSHNQAIQFPITDPDDPAWKTLKVKRGHSLSVLLEKAGVNRGQLVELMKLPGTDHLRRIHPGDLIKIMSNDSGQLQALSYQIDNIRYLQVERVDEQLVSNIHKHAIEVRTAYASGEIESSLFQASSRAGLSHSLAMELANIFGWDIDFALDIRKGDQFTVIYEQRYKDGIKIEDGNILAAEFINQGKTHRALRYANPVSGDIGYYSPSGHSLRKAFLRSPVNFSRISSRFTLSRYHPILHKLRAHKGVDYAAKRGTPVRASGDGKVVFKGRKGGYGKTLILKHGHKYTTLYAHLNSYNRKVRSGSRVRQGQVIGYVGSTGLASGPHLHYEFRVNGVHRNPLTVKFPSTQPIPRRYRDSFTLTTQGYIAQLDVLSRNALALNESQ